MSATTAASQVSRLAALMTTPSLDTLLEWCGEHCDGVRDRRITEFPDDLREHAYFWDAVRTVADLYKGRATFDVAVFYPGRDADGRVLPENNLADAIRLEVVRRGKTVYYADVDRDGRFDENIAAAVAGCKKAVFVVSGAWFERKWCLAEMLLAMASSDDDRKCKVVQYDSPFRAELLPLHQRVLRARFDDKKLLSEEAVRLVDWVLQLAWRAAPPAGATAAPADVAARKRKEPAVAAPAGSDDGAHDDKKQRVPARPIRVFVLSSAIDAVAYAKRLAPANRRAIVPPTEVFDLSVRVLTDVDEPDAPVLVVVKLPADVSDEVQADVDALFVSVRQPPAQVVPAALFDASSDERLQLSLAPIVDAGFRPNTEPAAELSAAKPDLLHRTATSVRVHAKRLSIAYVPEDNRTTLLKAVSEQWIAHTVGECAYEFAFLELHHANGDAAIDRIGDWKTFKAVFAAAVASTSSKHYLVLPSHVGALVACLVHGGAWARYLEWLAAQEDGEVSVLGLPPHVLDKAALTRLGKLGTDKVECFASAGELEARVGASAWSDAANWIGGDRADIRGDGQLPWQRALDFCFNSKAPPFDEPADVLRLFAQKGGDSDARWVASLQFAARLQQKRPPPCSAEQRQRFERVAELVGGAAAFGDDMAVLEKVELLVDRDREVPLELYEAVKSVVDERVKQLADKSVLPLVRVLDALDRAALLLDVGAQVARDGVRACVLGAMYAHVLAAHAQLPKGLLIGLALETALLWLGVVRQLEFFGRVPSLEPDSAVAAVESTIKERLRHDTALAECAAMSTRALKNRLFHLPPKLIVHLSPRALKCRDIVKHGLNTERLLFVEGDSDGGQSNWFDVHVMVRMFGEVFDADWKLLIAPTAAGTHTIVVLAEGAHAIAYHSVFQDKSKKAIVAQHASWLSVFAVVDETNRVERIFNELPEAVRAFQTT